MSRRLREAEVVKAEPGRMRAARGECPRCSTKLVVEATESRLELARCPRRLCGYAVWRNR